MFCTDIHYFRIITIVDEITIKFDNQLDNYIQFLSA